VFKQVARNHRNDYVAALVKKELDAEKPITEFKLTLKWKQWKRVVCQMLKCGAAAVTKEVILRAADMQACLHACAQAGAARGFARTGTRLSSSKP
jgi:hypothetical protein